MIKKIEITLPPGVLAYEPGYTGAFTRAHAPGAWPNGTRVRKAKVEPGDHHQTGQMATILGSLEHDGEFMYFVEWDAMPRSAVACLGWKLEPLP